MIAVTGMSSAIAREFSAISPEPLVRFRQGIRAGRYLFCQGVLHGRSMADHLPRSLADTFEANFAAVARACDAIFADEADARVVVIGSQSGFGGSYDMAYAGAKAALHLYVEAKRLGPAQQLVAIAPGIIADAGMTERRADQAELARRASAHPKGRFLTAAEVARLVRFLLFEDAGYLTGTVIRMHGGQR